MSASNTWRRLVRQTLFVGLFLLAATACNAGGEGPRGDGPRDDRDAAQVEDERRDDRGDGPARDGGSSGSGGDEPRTTIPTGGFPSVPVRSCASTALDLDGWTRPALDASPDGVTQIAVDGDPADWAGRDLFLSDRRGDSRAGGVDLTGLRAFRNADALYVLMELANPSGTITESETDLIVDGRSVRVGWSPQPDWLHPWIGDFSGTWVDLPDSRRSTAAFGNAIELRVDLRTLGYPASIEIDEVRIFDGECCGPSWQLLDAIAGAREVPAVDESDPLWRLAENAGSVEASTLMTAPDTRAITVDHDPVSQRAAITGAAGAVPADTHVFVGSLELNDFETLRAGIDGSFSADVAARPGTHILIKQDATKQFVRLERGPFNEDQVSPGVLIRIPVEQTGSGIAFASGARLRSGADDTASWVASGVYERDRVQPGDSVPIDVRVELIAEPGQQVRGTGIDLMAELLVDAGGRQLARDAKFVSSFLTATGLPVEMSRNGESAGEVHLAAHNLDWRLEGDRWIAEFRTEMEFDSRMRHGIYNVYITPLWGVDAQGPADHRSFSVVMRDQQAMQARVGTFTVGDVEQPRLSATLFADVVTEGARGGILAREDDGLFDISPRAMTRHNPVLPRQDSYGVDWRYRLEPHVPMLDVVDRSLPNPPVLDLDLTRSVLQVTVRRPDGVVDTLGPAPLTRYAVASPVTLWKAPLGSGGGELREIPQLLGDGDTFAYAFPVDGDYAITLEGAVAGIDGTVHRLCGTYDVTIAEPLDIESSFLPGTPFETGDSVGPTLTALPGIPVDVTFDISVVRADGSATTRTFSGRSNDHGWWDGGGETFTFAHDGEYLVTIEARGTDASGGLWVGRQRFGGLVATPDAPIIAHGRRGPDNQSEIAPPWAFEIAFVMEESDHMQFPYFTGDILWGMEQTDAGDAIVSHVSVQPVDQTHPLVERALLVASEYGDAGGVPFSDALRAGQVPLITGTEPLHDSLRGAHPDDIDLWSYLYVSAQRPGVRVREIIQGSDVSGSYWRFGDPYLGQSGNGPEGDLPGDFKFLYGGAVIRDPDSGEGVYAIYGSAWVHTVDDDPLGARFFPPFRGAAGGPDGGPLLTVHGRETDLFFMPMAVRPGAVLSVGDTFRMAGPIMPTLPSLVEYTVTAPDGTTRTHAMRGNAIGYAYDPATDFEVDQPGVWTVEVLVTHDGQTSAGPVEPPFPTGGVLSPDGKTFTFVVENASTSRTPVSTELEGTPISRWFERVDSAAFEARLPDGLSARSARVIVTMPGIVLVDEMVPVRAGAVRWEMVPEELNRLAFNFDATWSMGDTVTVTVHATDGDRHATGSIVTHGARVPLPTGT